MQINEINKKYMMERLEKERLIQQKKNDEKEMNKH